MSAELAILNKAKNNSGDTIVIFKEDYDEEWMLDISEKFFGRRLLREWRLEGNLAETFSNVDSVATPGRWDITYDNTVKYSAGISAHYTKGIPDAITHITHPEIHYAFTFWVNVTGVCTDDPNILSYNLYRELQNDIFITLSHSQFLDTNIQHPTALTFVAVSIEDNIAKIYHNGSLIWQQAVITGSYFYNNNILSAADNSDGTFRVSQIETYNTSITADEVLFLYNRSTPTEKIDGSLALVDNPDDKYKIVIMRDTPELD